MCGKLFPFLGSHNRVAETWKDNLLDELSKEESEIEMVEKLFSKMKNKFEEIAEEERKIE